MHSEIGDPDAALENMLEAWNLSLVAGTPDGSSANNLGFMMRELGDLVGAISMFEQGHEIAIQNRELDLVPVVLKNLGETWAQLGEREKAADLLQQSHDLYLEYDHRAKRLELYPVLIENLKALDRIPQAFAMMEEFKLLSDETINVDTNEKIAQLQSAVELERRNSELAASERDRVIKQKTIEVLSQRQKQQDSSRAYLALLVVALGILALLLVRANRFRARANQVLTGKNEQIQKQNKQLELLAADLKAQSLEDPLTGLHNRRYLNEFLSTEIPLLKRSQREDNTASMLVIMADLDNFKQINDQYGHATGDRVLIAAANALKASARESDVLLRWGGEEFCWLSRDTNIEKAGILCDRVRDALRAAVVEVGNERITVTCSFGFAPFPISEATQQGWEWSLKLADFALFQSKTSGRDRWTGYKVISWPKWQTKRHLDIDSLSGDGHIELLRAG